MDINYSHQPSKVLAIIPLTPVVIHDDNLHSWRVHQVRIVLCGSYLERCRAMTAPILDFDDRSGKGGAS